MSTYTQASMKGLLMVRFGVIQALKMLPVDDNIPNCKNQLWRPCMQDRKKDTDVYNGLLDSEGEGEGGMIWENGNSNMYTVM